MEDLDQYQSLYIRHVGCMWSEYGYANYDDDGENRDGDENWYQGRTTTFRANAAYSLYGVKKGMFSSLTLLKCSQHTYINTFITNNGADSILNITGRLSSSDDYYNGYGHAYCYEASNDDDDEQGERWLDSGDGDGDGDDGMSTTMGCSLEGYTYAMAVFSGGYCDGKYFMNTTDAMKDYNRAMSKVKCDKIYDASSAYSGGERIDTPADTLLEESSSCSNYMYDNRCPDPYGTNKSYKRRSRLDAQVGLRVLSWMALLVGLVLMAAGYYARHGKWIRRRGARMLRRMRSKDSFRTDNGDEQTLPTTASSSRRSSARSSPRNSPRKSKSRTPNPDRDGLVMEKKRSKKKSSRRSKSRVERGEDEL